MDQRETPLIGEITDIPFPAVDVQTIADPVPAIVNAPEFPETVNFFATTPAAERALIPPVSQALMYAVIRNQKPHNLVEIGSFKAGTTEMLARTIQGTGYGTLHTGSPYDASRFLPVYHRWPARLRSPVRYYQVDSMTLFMRLDSQNIRPDVVVIDGSHDFEFVQFDIHAAARRLSRGGFIFVNGVSQAGPYLAAMDFLAQHPEWHECGRRRAASADTEMKGLDSSRSGIDGTDLLVLRAPFQQFVGSRAASCGVHEWPQPVVNGLRLTLADDALSGTLFVQCILRGFSEALLTEVMAEAKAAIEEKSGTIDITFSPSLRTDSGMDRYVVEPWLAWRGEAPLKLAREIEVF